MIAMYRTILYMEVNRMLLNLLLDLIIGAASGWLITVLMKMDSSNMIFNCALGLIGGIVAGFLGSLLGIGAHGLIGSMIFSVAGGCLCVWAYRKFITR